MPSNYQAIAAKHIEDYGKKVEKYGEVLLARLYSDRTHFLYELMQNAEDALGKAPPHRHPTINFILRNDHLQVSHHGKAFSTEDVVSICALAESTKSNDITAIGKFGIGFKSVYAYTRHPEVHSGDEHFVIDAFVRPRTAEQV